MAFTDLGSIASGGSTSNNQSALTVATTANCAAGELVIVVVSVDNQATGGGDDLSTSGVTIGTSSPFALTKGRQNATNLAAQAGASVSLWWGILPNSVASGQNIVASFTTPFTPYDASALSARHFSFASLRNTVAVEATNATTATTTNPGSLTATTANIACLRIRATGCEYDSTQTITTTSTWTTWAEGASAATGTITEQVIECEHLISTTTSAASAPTLGSACDSTSVYVAFKEVANPFRLPILDVPRGPRRGRDFWIDAVGFIEAAAPVTLSADAGAYALTGSALTVGSTADTTNLPAGLADNFYPWGRKRPVQDWFRGQIPAVPVIFTAASGSYALTGTAAVSAFGQVAGSGSYTLTGSAATWALGHAAAAGSYTLTGTAATMAFGHAAGSGSYSITGSAAVLALGHVAGAGSYNLTGSAAGLTVAVNLAAAAGSYTSTGSAVTFAFGQGAAAGSYTLTGADAAFVIPGVVDYLPAGMSGGYVPWPSPPRPYWIWSVAYQIELVGSLTLTAEAGSYGLTGADAALTEAAPPDTDNLPAGATAWFNPWGWPFPVNLRTSTGRPLAEAPTPEPEAGDMPAAATNWFNPWGRPFPINLRTLTGRPLAAPTDITLTAAAGNYAITGATVSFVVASPPDTTNLPAGATVWFNPWRRLHPVSLRTSTGRPLAAAAAAPFILTAASGSYTLTGSAAALTVSGNFVLSADAGNYSITGASATLALRLTANSGAYTVSGTAAVLARGFAAGAGAYAITGTDAQLVQAGSITLVCGAGSYTLTGSDVSFGGTGITPPTVEAPGGNYAGVVVGASRGRMIRRRKRGELDLPPDLEPPPLSPPPPDLPPPAPGPRPPDLLPPQPGLLADMPQPQRKPLPPMPDDEDEDEIALLIKLLS